MLLYYKNTSLWMQRSGIKNLRAIFAPIKARDFVAPLLCGLALGVYGVGSGF